MVSLPWSHVEFFDVATIVGWRVRVSHPSALWFIVCARLRTINYPDLNVVIQATRNLFMFLAEVLQSVQRSVCMA